MNNTELLDTASAAALLGIAAGTLANERAAGRGPRFVRAGPKGGRALYRLEDVRAYLAAGESLDAETTRRPERDPGVAAAEAVLDEARETATSLRSALEVHRSSLETWRSKLGAANTALDAAAEGVGRGEAGAEERFAQLTGEIGMATRVLQALEERTLPQAAQALAAAEAGAADAERWLGYRTAQAASAESARRLLEYETVIAAPMVDLLRQLCRAEMLVADANRVRPVGAPVLPDPELAARARAARPETVVEVTEERLWTYAGTGHRLPDHLVAAVRQATDEERRDGKGTLRGELGKTRQGRPDVVLKPFRRVVFRAADPAVAAIVPLARVRLPGLLAGDPAFTPGSNASDATLAPAELLRMLDELEEARATRQASAAGEEDGRPLQTRYELVREARDEEPRRNGMLLKPLRGGDQLR